MKLTRSTMTAGALGLAALLLPATGLAQQNNNFSALQMSGDQPIEVESDKLEVRDQENVAVFSGNVSVIQGKTLLKTTKMIVYYADGGGVSSGGSSQIERLVADGKVYLKSEDQVATGDMGTFDMKAEVLVLTGKEVVLTQGENVVVGCKLTVQMKTGKSQLDGCGGKESGGRVKMLLQPGSQDR
ncbi:MAG: LPS ABC transporter substrate-binding protein LptA [Brucellaceae bacterium]|nr:LPS ABC transporter substrate-binding protein LptA [Brucellaceae bacterium]